RVHLSSLVDVPVTLGFLKPVILIPVAMITQLTPHQVEAILVHELAHIRRKDYLINLGVMVMELLFFFNPFARMLIGRLKNEREHCCDDLVLQFRYEPHAYVSALLSLARQHRQGRLAVAAIGAGGNRLLLQRARKILQQKRMNDRPRALPLFLFMSILSMTVLLAGVNRLSHPSPGTQTAKVVAPPMIGGYKPSPALAANRQSAVPHRTHRAQPPKRPAILLDGGGVTFLNTAGRTATPTPAFADRVVLEDRDYSIAESQADGKAPQPGDGYTESYPFVPQSSFSFQYTDTLPPEDKLAMMQRVTEKTIRLRIGQLKTEWKAQLDRLQQYEAVLDKTMAKANHSTAGVRRAQSDAEQQLQQLLRQHEQLQRLYLKKLEDLQHQLQRANRLLTTVYI
ncbi:MAG TPA: M56 family metallopeptidase, partial [Puia sp.]|nr:M56 family metallopeptidase [Puia sp.]